MMSWLKIAQWQRGSPYSKHPKVHLQCCLSRVMASSCFDGLQNCFSGLLGLGAPGTAGLTNGSGAKPPGWRRKYFTVEHEKMWSKMLPPVQEGGKSAVVSNASLDQVPTLADCSKIGAEIDGAQFAQLMVAGYLHLLDNMDRLNKENE